MYCARILALAATLSVIGCSGPGEDPNPREVTTVDLLGRPGDPLPEPPPPLTTDSIASNSASASAAPALPPKAERGAQGAQKVLSAFAAAVEARQIDRAWAMLGQASQNDLSEAQFRMLLSGLNDITVTVPDGQIEGAAGSLYYTSTMTISARNAQGDPVKMTGPIVLRRVDDVPGATPQQLRWHIAQVQLDKSA